MEDDETILNDFLKAEARPFAVHEAGHAVVRWALGGDVLFVEIDSFTLDGGKAGWTGPFRDDIKNLAVCVAGCRAEHLLHEFTKRKAKKGDHKAMRVLLSHFPKSERRAARVEGYRLADEKLKANADVVGRIAAELMCRWSIRDRVARIEGGELLALLDGQRAPYRRTSAKSRRRARCRNTFRQPAPGPFGYNARPSPDMPFYRNWRAASNLNQWAAGVTGLSVLLTSLSQFFP